MQFLFNDIAICQDSLSVIGKFIQGHPWTLDFGISSNLTLSTFQGTAISLNKFTSDYQKFRFGISTSFSNGTNDENANSYASDTLYNQSKATRESNDYYVQINFQYFTYATPAASTSLYFGIGPFAGIGWGKENTSSNSSYFASSQEYATNSETSNDYSLGILGSVGVEWFFSEHISLHAEYGLAASYSWMKSESSYDSHNYYQGSMSSSDRGDRSSSSSGWSLAGQRVLFGLSVNY